MLQTFRARDDEVNPRPSGCGPNCLYKGREHAFYATSIVFLSGKSQDQSRVAAKAPVNCAAMKAGASTGRIPEKVFVIDRASVTAGFANDVDAVNQYALVIYAPTTSAMVSGRKRPAP